MAASLRACFIAWRVRRGEGWLKLQVVGALKGISSSLIRDHAEVDQGK